MLDYPILLTDDGYPQAILENAFDVYIEDQVISTSSGSESLIFKLPYNDDKRFYITNEDVVRCAGKEFIVRTIDDDKSNDFYSTIYCEALWYEIANGTPIMSCNLVTVTADVCLEFILEGTGWKVGRIGITRKRTFTVNESEPINRLQAVRSIPVLYDCEMYFDTVNKTVNLVDSIGEDTQILVSYSYNCDSIKRNIDSRDLITRVYLYGKDNLNIKPVNRGYEYVENYDYYDELGKARVIKSTVIHDDRFTNVNELKAYGETFLRINGRPKYSYEVKVYLIGEMVNLGDNIIVYDKDLDIKGYMRVVSRKMNVLQPENSELQLDNTLKTMSDQMAANSLSNGSDTTVNIDNALGEVSMFNLLLNSRADYGFNYWKNAGFEIDNTVGVTGKASFKCTAELDKEKTLEQEADVSNRENYTLSAQIELQDLERNENSEIGFEVTIEFEDGTKRTQFISVL